MLKVAYKSFIHFVNQLCYISISKIKYLPLFEKRKKLENFAGENNYLISYLSKYNFFYLLTWDLQKLSNYLSMQTLINNISKSTNIFILKKTSFSNVNI